MARKRFKVRDETREEALDGERRAEDQEGRIVAYFRSIPREARRTPWDIAADLGLCINSARRAMTNLTDEGVLLAHRDDRRMAGPFGQKSRTWSLAQEKKERQGNLF